MEEKMNKLLNSDRIIKMIQEKTKHPGSIGGASNWVVEDVGAYVSPFGDHIEVSWKNKLKEKASTSIDPLKFLKLVLEEYSK